MAGTRGQVHKGEKATLVVFWKFANSATETDDGDDTPKSGPLPAAPKLALSDSENADNF